MSQPPPGAPIWRLAGSAAGLPPAAALADGTVARVVLRCALLLNVVVSMSNFNEDLLPTGSLQQYASIALWLTIVAAATRIPPRLGWRPGTDTLALLAFYGFAITSVAWSDLSFPTLSKAAALSITSVGAYCLATRIDLDDLVDDVSVGLFILVAASIVFVLFVPQIGIDHSWQHDGVWQGVFESKQSLGIAGGLLMFFACYRWLVRRGHLRFVVMFAAAAACVLGSESRGGGALALMAVVCLYAAGRAPFIARALAMTPFLMTLLAALLLGWFYATGAGAIEIFDTRIDFTERTLIWQYALAHFGERPILGFGINGFWSDQDIYLTYKRLHGWVLDNFHSGYLAVLMDTGVVGFALFALTTFLFGVRMSATIASRAMPRSHIVLLIGFMVLTYMIDFTETIFLRSTMLHATLVLVLLFYSSLPPVTARAPAVR